MRDLSRSISTTRHSSSVTANTYTFAIGTYTGGAHGLLVTRTFNFDENGKVINLADLFTNGEAGLRSLHHSFKRKSKRKRLMTMHNGLRRELPLLPRTIRHSLCLMLVLPSSLMRTKLRHIHLERRTSSFRHQYSNLLPILISSQSKNKKPRFPSVW